jgi:hypothetical protein
MSVLLNRLNALEASSGKGKEIATDSSESENEEIKMLKGFLAELGSKVCETKNEILISFIAERFANFD